MWFVGISDYAPARPADAYTWTEPMSTNLSAAAPVTRALPAPPRDFAGRVLLDGDFGDGPRPH
jgi:hypothetical protein